uniref:BTB domain-containing protein n=1 Tax=Panagrellus redivivus TaxID=6233 RepID=A0A7E4W9A7_PANRE
MPSLVSLFTKSRKPPNKPITRVKDEQTITISKTDLEDVPLGVKLTCERIIPSTNGVKWWIQHYPSGRDEESSGFIGIFVRISEAVKLTIVFKIKNSSIQKTFTKEYKKNGSFGFVRFAKHDAVGDLFVDGKLSIVCSIEFKMSVPFSSQPPPVFQHCGHVPMDFEIIVEKKKIMVHKSVLSLLSPVFNAMLSHKTKESKSGQVEIPDFDYATVKAAIKFCYGNGPAKPSTKLFIDILRFADKYNIEAITKHLEEQFITFLSLKDFCIIVNYAWDYSRSDLKKACAKFFSVYKNKVTKLPKFFDLSSELVFELLKLSHEFDKK